MAAVKFEERKHISDWLIPKSQSLSFFISHSFRRDMRIQRSKFKPPSGYILKPSIFFAVFLEFL